MNKIYIKFYPQKLFTLNEAQKIIKDKQVLQNTLSRLVKKDQIKRLRNTIYQIIPIDDPEFNPSKIHIAANIREDAIISCNSALIIHNILKEDSKEPIIYILYKHAAKIRIKDTTYKIIKNRNNFGIIKTEYQTPYKLIEVQTTDLERTIIDCIRTRSIKIEHLIPLLRNQKIELNINHIINYLEKYRKPILYNKIGLILETNKNFLKIDESDLEKIRKKLSKKIYYAREKGIRLIRPKYKYYKKWNMMITESLYELIIPKIIT
jgi:predicted transcriptional regulator of viral defense system